jgi:iron complex transport system substrate-binding protein
VRIVSLLPSATEIVYALGLGDQLEGRTFECDYPPEAQQKPIVSSSGLPENLPLGEIDDAVRAATAGETPLYRLDEARIAQIQPDLIFTQDLCRVCAVPSGDVDEALGRLGCRAEVVSLDPYSLDDVMIDIQNVGRAAGVDARADLLVDSLRARMAAVEASVSLASLGRLDAEPPRVLVLEWVDPPWGGGHWIPDMVELAGGEPVLGHKGGHAEVTTWDAVREEAPTIVVVAPCGYHLADACEQARAVLAELATTPAGRNNEVWAIDADAYVVRPGPRLVDGLELLSWIITGADGDPPHPHAVTRVS